MQTCKVCLRLPTKLRFVRRLFAEARVFTIRIVRMVLLVLIASDVLVAPVHPKLQVVEKFGVAVNLPRGCRESVLRIYKKVFSGI